MYVLLKHFSYLPDNSVQAFDINEDAEELKEVAQSVEDSMIEWDEFGIGRFGDDKEWYEIQEVSLPDPVHESLRLIINQ
jgi:hypothetical protein